MRGIPLRFVFALPWLLALPSLTAGEVTIYRCTDARGHLTLRDTPCAPGERQETRAMVRPRDAVPAAAPIATTPPPPPAAAAPAPILVLRAPQPLYECITPDGERYTNDSAEGRPRWVPLWTLGYPVARAPHHHAHAGADLAITGGNVSLHAGGSVLTRPAHSGHPWYPALAGTWIRDACHALPQPEVCARLRDRRDEIRRRFFNAQPSERDLLRVEERGINARLDSDCGAR
ncbi:DUF4124 domain-containing protein [Cognatiluteimonas weifangensis]|uniref:DUF4124 domain-containing protein n=1 Tax=Cognatiluteimonas weifangensis TaxID=2303539 RepID=A0A372DQ59_9GAMM|nr:DUF4124 domain-containing protein [Luteimonas weifangensis]RFP61547.1 DUF4124 domain-containing protein [Luteimonas weifangensis]